MSLASSINNAVSGLMASSKAAEIVSNNVANAMTEGYARRELDLSARVLGGKGAGVSVDGVNRAVDEALLRDRRLSDAAVGSSSVTSEFYGALERLIGTPEDAQSLGGLVGNLQQTLSEAASRPDSVARLQSVADAASSLARHVNKASEGVQRLRMDAESEITTQVDLLNASLGQIESLNRQIVAGSQSKRDTSGLLDLRQQELDKIASIVPLRVVERDNGRVSVFTMTGASLVDGRASKIEFTPQRLITAGSGPLGGLTIDGKPADVSGADSLVAGGSLGALFELRDEHAVAAQGQLDAVALDLFERFAGDTFSDAQVDPSLLPDEAGLFTDTAFTPPAAPTVQGLASRLVVNPGISDVATLRDGFGAGAIEDVGDGSLLQAMADALSAKRLAGAGDVAENRSAAEIASTVLSGVGVARQGAETVLAGASSQQATLENMQGAQGVDTDAEMQRLMLIEQSYAANARVISVADELMQLLLRI